MKVLHTQTGYVDLHVDKITDNLLKLKYHSGFKKWADELWKLTTANIALNEWIYLSVDHEVHSKKHGRNFVIKCGGDSLI